MVSLEKNLKLEKLHLYSYLAEDIVELINSCNKFNITVSKNIAKDKFLKIKKTLIETTEKTNNKINI